MYDKKTMREAIRLLQESPFWPGYSVPIKASMVVELAILLFSLS